MVIAMGLDTRMVDCLRVHTWKTCLSLIPTMVLIMFGFYKQKTSTDKMLVNLNLLHLKQFCEINEFGLYVFIRNKLETEDTTVDTTRGVSRPNPGLARTPRTADWSAI